MFFFFFFSYLLRRAPTRCFLLHAPRFIVANRRVSKNSTLTQLLRQSSGGDENGKNDGYLSMAPCLKPLSYLDEQTHLSGLTTTCDEKSLLASMRLEKIFSEHRRTAWFLFLQPVSFLCGVRSQNLLAISSFRPVSTWVVVMVSWAWMS